MTFGGLVYGAWCKRLVISLQLSRIMRGGSVARRVFSDGRGYLATGALHLSPWSFADLATLVCLKVF